MENVKMPLQDVNIDHCDVLVRVFTNLKYQVGFGMNLVTFDKDNIRRGRYTNISEFGEIVELKAELKEIKSVGVVDGRHCLDELQHFFNTMEAKGNWTNGHIRVALLEKKYFQVMRSWQVIIQSSTGNISSS